MFKRKRSGLRLRNRCKCSHCKVAMEFDRVWLKESIALKGLNRNQLIEMTSSPCCIVVENALASLHESLLPGIPRRARASRQ
jgi:hypothetical protein